MRADPSHESKFQWLARLGFAARGLLYMIIAYLVIATGRTEDVTGAMEYVREGTGLWLLIAMTAGMIGYGLWRLADTVSGMESGRGSNKAWRGRIASGASGVIYLLFAYKASRIILAGRAGTSDAGDHAETALNLPGGAAMLVVAGAVLAGAGLFQIYKASSGDFLHKLDDRARQYWAKWLGRMGYAARGVVFITIGFLLGRAGLNESAAGVGGLEQALDALSDPLEYAVAAGLMLFGAYSLIEARFRAVRKPPVEQMKRELNDAVGG